MQDKNAQVFVVATANDVTQLPPEMLRKGRFDEIMFVDLPNQAEREAIWEIQIGKHRRIPSEFDVVQLAKATDADSDESGHLFQSISDTVPGLSDSCRSEATL